jgi:hypothetical protein
MNMSTKPKIIKHVVVLGLKGLNPPQVVAQADHYVSMMTGNAYFQTPMPALADVTKQAQALDHSYLLALTKAKGTHNNMLVERKRMEVVLKSLVVYVEAIANADQENGNKIITSAGMTERKTRINPPRTFTVSPGKAIGSVLLRYPSSPNAVYVIQMTTDPTNPASWMQIYNDNRCRFTKTGLSSGTKYFFRAAIIVKGVQTVWSPVRDILVA